jgi:hypothetical protein
MRTNHSPSAMAARGGHPPSARGAVPKRKFRGCALLAAAIAFGLSACTRDAFFAALPEGAGQWPEVGQAMSQSAVPSRMDQ